MIRRWKLFEHFFGISQSRNSKKKRQIFPSFIYWLYLYGMKQTKTPNDRTRQRSTVLLALLFCLFISSIEYVPSTGSVDKIEKQQQPVDGDQNKTFLAVAVDAVVPFAVHVSQSVLYFIYELVRFNGTAVLTESTSIFHPNQLVEILFERIISTKGP